MHDATEPFSFGDNIITWTANDGNGQSVTCLQTVTVEDNEDPVAICPTEMPIVNLDKSGIGTLAENALAENSTDNCKVASETSPEVTFDCEDNRTQMVTLTVVDLSGNSHSTECNIILEDSIDPVAVCPSSTIVTLDENGMGTLPLNALIGNSTDNCSVATEFSVPASYDCDDIGIESVVLIATDNSGNLNTISCDITIIDGIPPVITCPEDIVVSTDEGACSASGVTLGTAIVTDNCESITATDNGTTTYDLGVTIVTWTGTYNVDQTVTCEQSVTVEDNENPVALCPESTTISLDEDGMGSLAADALAGNSIDNCTEVTETSPAIAYTCANIGEQMVVLTVVDGSSNQHTASCSVSVVDGIAPVAVCPTTATVVSLDEDGIGSLAADALAGNSTDNCSVATETSAMTAYSCSDIGTHMVTLTVADGSGNTHTVDCMVSVEDNYMPSATCQDVTVELDIDGNGILTTTEVDNGSFDNCDSNLTLSLNQTMFDCDDIGASDSTTPVVTLTVTDDFGNSSTCSAIVTVEDNMAPTINCPDNVFVNTDSGICTASNVNLGVPTVSDNCASIIPINDAVGPYVLGANTVTWTANDGYGQMMTCTQTVTVLDNEIPVISCPADVIVNTDEGKCTASSVNLGAATATDNCADITPESDAVEPYDLGINIVTWTADDGQVVTCEQTVTVVDNEAPVAVCPTTATVVSLDADGMGSLATDALVGSSTDNCGAIETSEAMTYGCSDIGIQTVTLAVVDNSGNSNSVDCSVVIVDDVDPIANCQDVTIYLDANEMATVSVDQVNNNSTDACGILSMILDVTTFGIDDLGANTVTLTVEDMNTNVNTCESTVTVSADVVSFVWDDRDGNGLQDVSEPALPGIDVNMLDASGATIATTTTNANGRAIFSNTGISDGATYKLSYVLPTYHAYALQNQVDPLLADSEAIDSDVSRTNGQTDDFTFTAGTTEFDIDAGLFTPGLIRSFVWDDLDGDGRQDANEPAIPGVEVRLIDANNSVIKTATSDALGEARLNNVPADVFLTLEYIAPTHYAFALRDAGVNDNIDSDVVQSTGRTLSFKTDRGAHVIRHIDCGMLSPSVIESFVWEDLDGDGRQDLVEPGIPGIMVDLLTGNSVVETKTTDSNGLVMFDNIVANVNYRIQAQRPSVGHAFTLLNVGTNDNIDSDVLRGNGLSEVITVTRGSDLVDNVDIGIWSPSTVESYVWLDGNSNGRQDATETGVSGVVVNLLDASSAVVATQSTGTDGLVTFTNVAANSVYTLAYTLPASHTFTLENVGSDLTDSDVVPSTGVTPLFNTIGGSRLITNFDAGLIAVNSSIETFVWDDLDGNSTQDANEPGLANIDVNLLSNTGTLLETKTTDANGLVKFTGLLGNTSYRLSYDLPTGHTFVVRDAAADDIDSDVTGTGTTGLIALGSGNTEVTDVDAGMWSPGTIETYVWDDLNGDGIQDAGEPALSGIEVHLIEGNGSIVETKTTVNGFVTFTNVYTGIIRRIQCVLPADHEYTLLDQGQDDNLDSDANRNNGKTNSIRLLQGQAFISDLDIGLWTPGQLETFVWDDLNQNGLQDAGEPGIESVQVELVSGTTVLNTQTTDANGIANFAGVPADRSLRVRYTRPVGYRIATRFVGSNDEIDSDPTVASGLSLIFSADRGNQTITNIDAGMYVITSLAQGNNNSRMAIVKNIEGKLDKDELIFEENSTIELEVYPNPVTDVLSVDFTTLENSGQLFLVNAIGQVVWTTDLEVGMNKYKFEMSSLNFESGIYELVFVSNNFYQSRKIYFVR